MTTALDLIIGGLRNINSLEAGETPSAQDANDALTVLNDLIDSLSTDEDYIFTQTENILAWTPGQFKYSIGNPVGGTFTGTLVNGSPTISNVTVPSNLIAKGDLSDIQGQIPSGTTILSFNAGANTVTMSQNALSTVAVAEVITYTTPGDIKIARPLRIASGYTRITSGVQGIDYWFDCHNHMDNYNQLGFKGVSGPWPKLLAFQQTFPLGTVWVYPNPSQAGEVHLFTDLILTQFTSINQTVSLPQGYSRSLKKLLGLELCPEFGKTPSRELIRQAKEARDFIKAQNASPVPLMNYDSAIVRSQTNDAGWIMSGGFI
jgi:hypothetical protein